MHVIKTAASTCSPHVLPSDPLNQAVAAAAQVRCAATVPLQHHPLPSPSPPPLSPSQSLQFSPPKTSQHSPPRTDIPTRISLSANLATSPLPKFPYVLSRSHASTRPPLSPSLTFLTPSPTSPPHRGSATSRGRNFVTSELFLQPSTDARRNSIALFLPSQFSCPLRRSSPNHLHPPSRFSFTPASTVSHYLPLFPVASPLSPSSSQTPSQIPSTRMSDPSPLESQAPHHPTPPNSQVTSHALPTLLGSVVLASPSLHPACYTSPNTLSPMPERRAQRLPRVLKSPVVRTQQPANTLQLPRYLTIHTLPPDADSLERTVDWEEASIPWACHHLPDATPPAAPRDCPAAIVPELTTPCPRHSIPRRRLPPQRPQSTVTFPLFLS